MKKICGATLAVVLLFLTACSGFAGAEANSRMVIKPGEFSQETRQVLEIFDDELLFLDCAVDETVRSYAVRLWVYTDGAWVETGGVYGGSEFLVKRLAMRLTDRNYTLYIMDENGHSTYNFPAVDADFSASTVTAEMRLQDPTPISLHTEIPLWVKLGSDKNALSASLDSDFRDADCNAGVAVTVTFSDREAA